MAFDRLTWVGLMLVALGWAVLLSGASAIEAIMRVSGRAGAAPVHLAAIAQAAILTGFGLAILGALQSGFGALKRFFDTVLERTARTAQKVVVEPPSQQQPAPKTVIERGLLKDRPYILFGDGTIEIETLLGIRRFASMREAHEFIGA